ncbi:MAG: SDR family oxidoreductase [Pseudomonadota bacterium]|nr:SDR family oxidoreductase [Pseudomonadota bacterium]
MALSRRLDAAGWTIRGTCRQAGRQNALSALGINAALFDGSRAMDHGIILDGVTHVLISIPPDNFGDPAFRHHAEHIAESGSVKWVGYLSTTGVYGNQHGNWVDETTILKPSSTRSKRRVVAEETWRNWGADTGIPTQIFRLAGIYGPGRSVADKIKSGTAQRIAKPSHLFSRIHVEDVATVLAASITQPEQGGLYNVCDDEPATPSDVVAYASELMGRKPPPEISLDQANLSPMAKSFWADNRKVRNERIKDRLGVELAFPNYRTGLRAILGS